MCSHFNIKDGRKHEIFCILCFISSIMVTMWLKCKIKDLCNVWRKCCDWPNVSKVVCKVSWYFWYFGQIILCCGAVLRIGRCLAASTHYKAIKGDSWHAQNTQINKVIGENEKWVFYFRGKTEWTFWSTQYKHKKSVRSYNQTSH